MKLKYGYKIRQGEQLTTALEVVNYHVQKQTQGKNSSFKKVSDKTYHLIMDKEMQQVESSFNSASKN